MEALIVGVIAVVIILLAVAVNVLLMPYLLMIALDALGHDFSFGICIAFWLVAITLFKAIAPKKTVNNNK
jgi:hypothetical protein